eukprot:TRINITY_DN1449_c0_g1_i2.p1 TRINITY_DN1449_c0_g1~~TRINITY_DN1449_c0_g1_i2.p1  ORF type:complete len:126 (-),score=28.90 TRINITY_DN1449_c0_g1_i2:402-779(-)
MVACAAADGDGSRCSRCGAVLIDADKLGHESYELGQPCYKKLVEEFGEGIVAPDGTINRYSLLFTTEQSIASLPMLSAAAADRCCACSLRPCLQLLRQQHLPSCMELGWRSALLWHHAKQRCTLQ